MPDSATIEARRLHITGVVQGVGFRPFVYRCAVEFGLCGWVRNGERGVEIHVEGPSGALDTFAQRLRAQPPAAARVAAFESVAAQTESYPHFEIRESERHEAPTVDVCADLPVCDDCLRELFDPSDRRYHYPYITCTNCGPRYSIVRELPYDRAGTTMARWMMCAHCRAEYDDPRDRRYHAQPLACPACGPSYALEFGESTVAGTAAIESAAGLLRAGKILAIKGLGGFHLACDARNAVAVAALRERKFRKERPFAVMVSGPMEAHAIADVDAAAETLLRSQPRPIVLVPAKARLPGVAPDNDDLGVMLPYTPLHHLLFAAGAPSVLVMTSGNRSSEPIAYRNDEAHRRLGGIADAFLTGERDIARRVDDSVVRSTPAGPAILRHARGYAPRRVARIPERSPMLAVGADLKNAVALAVRGNVFMSQHLGDLEFAENFDAFTTAISDLRALYEIDPADLVVVHDAHPEYRSSAYALDCECRTLAVQHHRAHVASVLTEREAFAERAIGFAFDGTGYGEDGTIWGGEVFAGAMDCGLERVAHLRSARLPGGDAAARFPVQCAAGFLAELPAGVRAAVEQPPFGFPSRYRGACELLRAGVRVFSTTSMGRLFDAVAALLGFTREITFEAQAAMWLEHLARAAGPVEAYMLPFANGELDYRPLLLRVVDDRRAGRDPREIALAFHGAIVEAILTVVRAYEIERVVVSGGVFQNALLVNALSRSLGERLWTNERVPANDGGIALGQAGLAACARR